MSKKAQNSPREERKVDLRNVMVSEETNLQIDEYVLNQKKNKRVILKGEATVELIERGLEAEGIR